MFWKNNWLSYNYNDNCELLAKLTPELVWRPTVNKTISRPLKSYREELLLNAQSVRDRFTEPLDLMLSGGVDSEIVLRCYLELKIPVNVFIFKYEDDINILDFNQALSTCTALNVTPKIIDLNLKKFFENEAYDIWIKGYFLSAGKLVHMKMIEYLDNIPIMCDGLGANSNTLVQGHNEWQVCLSETLFNQTIYCNTIKRPMIPLWHEFSPELVASFLTLDIVQQFTKNKFPSIKSFNDLKYIIHNLIWGTAVRDKLVGFEGDNRGQKIPKFMNDFNKMHTHNVKQSNYMFDLDDFLKML